MGKDHDLLEAARNGNIAVVGKLLDQITKRSGPLSSFRRSPSINSQDVNGYTPLHHACLNGHSNVVCLLLAHNATPDVPDIRGSTPLYLAAWAGHQDIVKMLLMHPQKPANPNAQTIENETPLHCAAQHGHNAALAILLAYGADPSIRNNSFQTALDLAAQFGRLQAVQILIRTHAALLEPLKSVGNPAELKNGGGVTTKHMFTHTCLHLASRNGHKKVVATLLAAGVDVNILTHAGTALHEAALCGKKSVVSILLNAGVDPQATDGNGRTALDILKDYPPHVTYEIVSVIKDFCRQNLDATKTTAVCSPEEFGANQNGMRDKSHSLPKSVYEKKSKKQFSLHKATQEPIPKNVKPTGLSSSMSSLESPKPSQFYLKMKPILWQKSSSDIVEQVKLNDKQPPVYNPVYKQPCIIARSQQREISAKAGTQNGIHKSYEHIYLAKSGTSASGTGSGSEANSSHSKPSSARRYNCVDEYVVMSEPTSSKSSLNSTASKKPFPSPRNFEASDYANMNFKTNTKVISVKVDKTILNTANAADIRATDANNNKAHSPSPEFPPPSVTQAEHTILEFIQPLSVVRNKRRSMRIDDSETLEHLDASTFDQADSADSLGSRISDCVEKFVGDAPFAGLFKGSSLNLSLDENIAVEQPTTRLRSPSLVKSIKPIPAKRKVSLQNNVAQVEFNEALVWDEINTILESIGNEVANADVTEKTNGAVEVQTKLENDGESFRMRSPSDLLLGMQGNINTNWCHSASTLLYGQVLYNVYYLGSTVIRVLLGTTSTRKSIQRLKRDETPPAESELEVGLVKDCSTSTRYLKASSQQTRLKVGIALSHMGVKFVDNETKSTFCIHDIENINCVCQDADDLRYFAYITKENDMHYCHVFMVDSLELAKEILLTFGQAFEVAYQLALGRAKSPIVEETLGMENF